MLSGLLNPVNGWSPYFRCDILLLFISISALASLLGSAIFSNMLSICQSYTCAPLPVSFLFSFSDFLACDSSGSVSLPERVHQMHRHRLQLECVSKCSGYVGGFDLTHSLFSLLLPSAECKKKCIKPFYKSFVLM